MTRNFRPACGPGSRTAARLVSRTGHALLIAGTIAAAAAAVAFAIRANASVAAMNSWTAAHPGIPLSSSGIPTLTSLASGAFRQARAAAALGATGPGLAVLGGTATQMTRPPGP